VADRQPRTLLDPGSLRHKKPVAERILIFEEPPLCAQFSDV